MIGRGRGPVYDPRSRPTERRLIETDNEPDTEFEDIEPREWEVGNEKVAGGPDVREFGTHQGLTSRAFVEQQINAALGVTEATKVEQRKFHQDLQSESMSKKSDIVDNADPMADPIALAMEQAQTRANGEPVEIPRNMESELIRTNSFAVCQP